MSLVFSLFTLACVGVSLILITLSLRYLRTTATPADSTNSAARFFLIALRVAIGWHCFVEGMEKVSTPTWSSEGYLRESIGPFSAVFRSVAGDRLLENLDLGDADTFPAPLEKTWLAHMDLFAAHYELTDEQRERAKGIFAQRKQDTLTTFISKTESVSKIVPFTPELKLDMTMKDRVKEHHRLAQTITDLEAKFPTSDKGAHAAFRNAKADLNRWRGGMKKGLDDETTRFKKALDDVLSKEEKKEKGPLPEATRAPLGSWRLLEWSDFAVKWSLVILGACLMLGLLSRTTSLATALLVLSFYAAMPALPGWPESPRLEGHYLLVNKTLIEVIALLALTFIPTGRWAGLDGLCTVCCGAKSSKSTTEAPQPDMPSSKT